MADEWPVLNSRPVVWCNRTFYRCNNSVSRAVLIPGRLPAEAVRCQGVLQVQSDWMSVTCIPHGSSAPRLHSRAVNALSQEVFEHADVFLAFRPALLQQKPRDDPDPYLIDFMGNRYPPLLFCNNAYTTHHNEDSHAIRTRQCQFYRKVKWLTKYGQVALPAIQTTWPVIAEEYFEYMDVLSSVMHFAPGNPPAPSSRPYTFIELGSGYGHWSFAAHSALEHRTPGAPYHFLLVDVVASLREAIQELARINGVRTTGANHSLHFHVGFVTEKNHSEHLNDVELLGATRQAKMYTQLWGTGPSERERWKESISKAESLDEIFQRYHTPECIDMVDIDIQGNEYVWKPGDGGGERGGHPGLFATDRSLQTLTRRAKRIHIGLHASSAYDKRLIAKFRAAGWRIRWYFPMSYSSSDTKEWAGERTSTPFGPIMFNDGVLSLINTNWPCDRAN